ncbi:MAG: hypothetical protein AB4041_17385 [Microcystaceae cyanobacterium]|jgi:regulator of replication initiation timing
MLSVSKDQSVQLLKQELVQCHSKIQWYQSQLQDVEEQLTNLEEENWSLKRFNEHLSDKVAELECRVDPYSLDGTPVCNSLF